MPKNNADCGKREERAIVRALEARGYKARRQPGSGNIDPTLPHDVVWEDSPIGRVLIESKWRATCGWRTLLKWMEGAPMLILKGGATNQHDMADPEAQRYVFMKFDTFMAMVGEAAERCSMVDLEGIPTEPVRFKFERPPDPIDLLSEQNRRNQIQSAHQNPPQKPLTKRKLQGRGFSKGKSL